jgi:drug/metabolite transporter (DMT)-like permease
VTQETARHDGAYQAGDDNIPFGILLTVAAIGVFGLQDAVAKMLVQTHSPFQVVMMRYWAFSAFSLFLVSRQAPLRRAFASKAPGLQLARGVLLMGDVWLFAFAIQSVPLAEVHSIALVFPLLATVFSIPMLGEKVGRFRWAAVGVGFAGTMIILRPGFSVLQPGSIFALLAAVAYALYFVLTRKVAKRDSTATSMLYASAIGLVLSTGVGVFHFTPMGTEALLMLAFLMVTTCAGHALIMASMRYAPASVVQPFNFLMLPWAITLSFVLFQHLIDPISLVGALIVVGAGLTVMWRERRKHVSSPIIPPPPDA